MSFFTSHRCNFVIYSSSCLLLQLSWLYHVLLDCSLLFFPCFSTRDSFQILLQASSFCKISLLCFSLFFRYFFLHIIFVSVCYNSLYFPRSSSTAACYPLFVFASLQLLSNFLLFSISVFRYLCFPFVEIRIKVLHSSHLAFSPSLPLFIIISTSISFIQLCNQFLLQISSFLPVSSSPQFLLLVMTLINFVSALFFPF